MGKISCDNADVVVITSDNPRSEDPQAIIDEIMEGTTRDVEIFVDRREAIEFAIENACQGDAVIVAGKGHEQGQIFADHIGDFSDIDVVTEILGKVQTE